MCRSLYIDKRWKTDEKRIGDMIEHLATQYHSSTSQNSPNQNVQNRSNSNFQFQNNFTTFDYLCTKTSMF